MTARADKLRDAQSHVAKAFEVISGVAAKDDVDQAMLAHAQAGLASATRQLRTVLDREEGR